ncbi:MAG: FAD-dependent oxidoreductase, partial [Paracoccaceae bacterium]
LDTGVNWPVHSGLGALIAGMAAGLPVRLNSPVTKITERPGGVRVEGPAGALEARAAIVTLSTNVLLSGAVALPPGSARGLLDHMAYVPCGSYEKVALALDRLPEEVAGRHGIGIGTGEGPQTPWFQAVGGSAPMLILHIAGDNARALVAAGEVAMKEEAIRTLQRAFGADIRKRVTAAAVTGWQENPLIRGGYSFTLPGHPDARMRMITADTGRIAFAGEAFSVAFQATAHGAFQTGQAAVARLAASL